LPAPTKPKDKRAAAKEAPLPDAGESRAAVATTVAWMLLTLSCAAAQVVAAGIMVVAQSAVVLPDRPNALTLVASTLLFVALLTGLLVLLLTPLVYRVRKTRPPPKITILAVIIAATPVLLLLALAFLPFILNPEP
jgi:hypothetical protein